MGTGTGGGGGNGRARKGDSAEREGEGRDGEVAGSAAGAPRALGLPEIAICEPHPRDFSLRYRHLVGRVGVAFSVAECARRARRLSVGELYGRARAPARAASVTRGAGSGSPAGKARSNRGEVHALRPGGPRPPDVNGGAADRGGVHGPVLRGHEAAAGLHLPGPAAVPARRSGRGHPVPHVPSEHDPLGDCGAAAGLRRRQGSIRMAVHRTTPPPPPNSAAEFGRFCRIGLPNCWVSESRRFVLPNH